jgi:hypothetical protein
MWLMNHYVERRLFLAGYPLPILMMSPQGQVHTVEIQLEPTLHLINPSGGVYHRGTVGCTVHNGSTAHLYKTFHHDCQQGTLSDTALLCCGAYGNDGKITLGSDRFLAHLTTLFLI